jgi:hypothetical protein
VRVPVPNLIHIPRVEQACIPEEKLRLYVLSPRHGVGQHKARFFEAHLGIGPDDWEYLHDQLMQGLPEAFITEIGPRAWRDERGRLKFGITFRVPVTIEGLNGKRCEVHTGWILHGGPPPAFVTVIPPD